MGDVLSLRVYMIYYGISVALLTCCVDYHFVFFVDAFKKLLKVRTKVESCLKV